MSYREGTIYNLSSPNTNQCYIGCTTKDLKTTFTHLRAYSKRNRGNVIIEAGDAQIEVLETFHDITISALRKELGKVQEKYADVCVENVPGYDNARTLEAKDKEENDKGLKGINI